MYLSPTDFVAKNVSVMVKYMNEEKPKWYHGYVKEVLEYGHQDGHHYVEVNVMYDEEEDVTTETLWDYDYEADTEDSWRFSKDYAPLVENVLNTLEERLLEEQLEEDEDEDSEEVEEEEEEDDDFEDDFDDDRYDQDVYIVKKKPSLLNRFFATLFVFSPLIATFGVLYNARHDIGHQLKYKYCYS